jgi:hypothetical protein
MAACEACWAVASHRALVQGGSVVDHYRAVLLERDHEPEVSDADPT